MSIALPLPIGLERRVSAKVPFGFQPGLDIFSPAAGMENLK